MSLEVFVSPGLQRGFDPTRWWVAIERNIPRAMLPVAHAMRSTAPKGRTGKLSRGFEVKAKPVSQGLVQGVEVQIGSRSPYAHLVERGHQIIARGPGRKKGLKRERRAELRSRLKARREAGPIGFVPGRFFGRIALDQRREQVLSLLERLVIQDVMR